MASKAWAVVSHWRTILADAIITLCVGVGVVVTAVILWEYHRLDTPMPADVLNGLLRFWGGELLIIALRQIFGSDIVGKFRKKDSTEESTI